MNTQRVSDLTLGELTKGLNRYRPFMLMVAGLALVGLVLPGVHGSGSHATSTNTAGPSAGQGAAGTGPDTGASTAVTQTAAAVTSASGSSTYGGSSVSASGGKASQTAAVAPARQALGAAPDPNCDPATGRVFFPSVYAVPCAPPYNGNNGGATNGPNGGVSATQITICNPQAASTPQGQAIAAALGDTDTAQQIHDSTVGYINMFQHHFQTWGRTVNVVDIPETGTDDAANKADAITCAKKIHGFMSWGSPGNAYLNELVADKVLCLCTVTLPKDFYLSRAPYVWGTGLPDENQAYIMRAEMIGKQIAGRTAKFSRLPGGAPSTLAANKRSFGLIWYNTGDNAYVPGEKFFESELAKYGVHLTDQAQYAFDLNTAQQDSQTIMSKFASENITSVIFVGDPIYPEFFTAAATKQAYYPEWIVTGSALTDTTFFARVYDKDQWDNAFGLGLVGARADHALVDPVRMYNWEYGTDPPAHAASLVIYGEVLQTFIGISLAGPTLNVQTFKQGMFSYPVSPAKNPIINPTASWGNHLWPWDDYNFYDDSTEIWWDSTAQGPDEQGTNGQGMYRYVNMGLRFTPGKFPTSDFPAFDPNNTVLIYSSLPPSDVPPGYDPGSNKYTGNYQPKKWYCPENANDHC